MPASLELENQIKLHTCIDSTLLEPSTLGVQLMAAARMITDHFFSPVQSSSLNWEIIFFTLKN